LDNNNTENNDNKELKEEFEENESLEQDIIEDDGSRTNRRSRSERRTWFVVSIIVVLFLIVLVPTGAIIYSQMSGNLDKGKTTPTSKPIAVASSTTKESETKSTESTKESSTESTTESSVTSSSSSSSTSETFSDVEVPKDDPSTRGQVANNQNGQDQTQTQGVGGQTVAYGQGDGSRSLWKIAQEAGISLEQLYQLNPGVTANNVQPGQPIRVK